MDIGAVVKYEQTHKLRVTFPNSDRYLGLTVNVRNSSSETVKAMIRKLENERRAASRGKQRKTLAEDDERNELETTAACIESWRWEMGDPSNESKTAMAVAQGQGKAQDEIDALNDASECTYEGGKPELSHKLAINILDKIPFIYAQIREASINIENFMPTASSGSVNT